ncbi:MAG: ComF family protein [Anaerovoracaceae bacterium]
MNLRGIFSRVTEAVFPSNIYCLICGSMIDETRVYSLCDKCMGKIHWIGEHTCSKCGKALSEEYRGQICYDCMIREHKFKKGYSCMTYGLYERRMIFDCKYNGKGYIGQKFGDIMYDRIMAEDLNVDLITAVPIHKSREKSRGYNQTEIMAKRLSHLWNIPFKGAALKRTVSTPLLRSLAPADRESVLKGAFAVDERYSMDIRGKKILLVDDIYTTGATADECSKTLMACGAEEIYLLSLASGGNRKPEGI